MKATYIIAIVLVVIAIMLAACEHEPKFEEMIAGTTPPDTTGGPVNEEEGNPCSSDTVYFVNDIMPILRSNCAFSGCHGDGSAQDGVDLTTYSSVISTGEIRPFNPGGSELYEKITEHDPDDIMPPPPANPLSAEQIEKIAKWINQGALNNSCNGCDTSNVTFSLSVAPIIQNNCRGCHSGGNPAGGILLTDYISIQTQALSGRLLGAISHDAQYVAMPYNQPKLSQCKIDQIRIWIDSGAPNN